MSTTEHPDPLALARCYAHHSVLHSSFHRELTLIADEIEALRADLSEIARHWPGKWTRYCCECDDEPWPCRPVLDLVVPWMTDDTDPNEGDDQ